MTLPPIFPLDIPQHLHIRPPLSTSTSSTEPPFVPFASMLKAQHARMKDLPEVLHQADPYALPSGTLAYAERVREALQYANYDPTSPRWAKVSALAKLGCTRSRTRLLPYKPPKPAQPGRTYLLAETEEEWLVWEEHRNRERDQQRNLRRNVQMLGAPGAEVVVAHDTHPSADVLEKVALWQVRLSEPQSQLPAASLSEASARPPVQASQSRLSFTTEKKNTAAASAKGKESKKPSRQSSRQGVDNDDFSAPFALPIAGPSRLGSQALAPAVPTTDEPIHNPEVYTILTEPFPPSFPSQLPRSTPKLVRKGATGHRVPTNSQMSGLSSPPITPSKHRLLREREEAVAGPFCLAMIAEASSQHEENEVELNTAPPPAHVNAEAGPSCESLEQDVGTPKRRRPLTPPSEDTPPLKRMKRIHDTGMGAMDNAVLLRTSTGSIPGLSKQQLAPVAPDRYPGGSRAFQPVLDDRPLPAATAQPIASSTSPREGRGSPVTLLAVPPTITVPLSSPPRFTQNPELFTPGETSILGDRAPLASDPASGSAPLPPTSGPFTASPGITFPVPGTFTQNPDLFAPADTSLLGARPPPHSQASSAMHDRFNFEAGEALISPTRPMPGIQPPASSAPPLEGQIGPGTFTQQPALFNPAETSVLGVRELGFTSSPPAKGMHNSFQMSSPVFGRVGSISRIGYGDSNPQPLGSNEQAQVQESFPIGSFTPLATSPEMQGRQFNSNGQEQEEQIEPPSPLYSGFGSGSGSGGRGFGFGSLGAPSYNSSFRAAGMSDLAASQSKQGSGIGSGCTSGFRGSWGTADSADLYCSQLDARVEDDVGETSRVLERDVEYEKWLDSEAASKEPMDEDEDGNGGRLEDGWRGSSQEVREVVGMD